MNGDDESNQQDAADLTASAPEDAMSDDQEITLTFSYDPQATLEELFGIGEETLFHAFDLTLARIGVTESVEVSVLITTDEGIRTLNREYRGKDEPTDVLSFPLLDHPLVDAPADQLWQATDDEAPDDDDLDGEFQDDEESDEQPLKGKIVLIGDDEGEDEDDDELGDDEFADDSDTWPTHLGDIAISRETTLRQAQAAGHSAAYEVAFLFVHGVLHLVGFDDHTDAGYQAMVAHQEAVLAQAGVTRQV
jgi:probable rRNA maturation factor